VENFCDATTAAPVPVDVTALHALKRSPLALDLYAGSTYRTHRINQDALQACSGSRSRKFSQFKNSRRSGTLSISE
jgi:hypothetical protein